MFYNRKSRKKQRTVRLGAGEEGELAVKQKKTASMKQKFVYMAVTMVAASLGVFLCLYPGSQRHYGTDQADYG